MRHARLRLALVGTAAGAACRAAGRAGRCATTWRWARRRCRSHDLRTALAHYEAALALDSTDYEANWRAAIALLDEGEQIPDSVKSPERDSLYARAERLARRAVAADSMGADGHFALAAAVGRASLTHGQEGADPPGPRHPRRGARAPSRSTPATTAPTTSWAAGTRRSCGCPGSAASSPRVSWARASSARRRGRRRSPTWSGRWRSTPAALPPARAGRDLRGPQAIRRRPRGARAAGGAAGPGDHGQLYRRRLRSWPAIASGSVIRRSERVQLMP